MVGAVPGLQSTINADGSMDLEIRGQSSLNADRNPLVVVDGFPVDDGFESIDPNEVESINVLKDAAAASIWGAKAANGVIVVTTKEGKKGKTKVSFSSHLKISPQIDLGYAVNSASPEDIIEYEQRGFDTDFFGGLLSDPPGKTAMDATTPYSQAIVAMNEARLGRISKDERDATLEHLKTLNNRKQIKDHLLQHPITRQVDFSISGGNENMQNRLSLLYEDNKRNFKGDKSNKYQINYKNQIDLTKWLDFDFSGTMQYEDQQNNGTDLETIKSLAPWDMLLDDDGNLTDMSYLTQLGSIDL